MNDNKYIVLHICDSYRILNDYFSPTFHQDMCPFLFPINFLSLSIHLFITLSPANPKVVTIATAEEIT